MNRIYIQTKQIKRQEPIKEKDPVDIRTLWLILLTCSLIVLGILSYIWRNVEIIRIGYKMRALYYQRDVLQEQRQKLVLQKASLRSMKRIETIASSQLSLVKPNPDQMVILPHSNSKDAESEKHDQ